VIAAAACGDLRRPSVARRRFDVTVGLVVAAVSFIAFVVAAAIGRHISVLAGPIDDLLAKADTGPVIAVLALALVNAVAEELFFRGVLVDAVGGRRAAVVSVLVYVAVTAVAGNTALTIAAFVMGVVWTVERLYTNARTASIVTHVVWSTLMILALPR
jgi:membrane protease YdiL (CAAX protease family)